MSTGPQTEVMLTAADVAEKFRCSPRKVRDEAKRIGAGINLGGRAGFRFTEDDVVRIKAALGIQAAAPVERRRRRRRSA